MRTLFLLSLLMFSACRSDPPPQIIICIGDGFGGADCSIPGQQQKEYWSPSKLENSWITTQDEMARFTAWCYKTDLETARTGLREKLGSLGLLRDQ